MAAPTARFAHMKVKGDNPLQTPASDPLSNLAEVAAATRVADVSIERWTTPARPAVAAFSSPTVVSTSAVGGPARVN